MERWILKSWTLSLLAIALAHADALAQDKVLYRASEVHTMLGPPLRPGEVLVENGKIQAVGSRLDVSSDVEVVDLGGTTLMPGFVDAWNRAGLSGGTDENTREVTPEFATSRVIDWEDEALDRALHQGTTTLSITPGTANVVAGRSSVVKTAGNSTTRILRADDAVYVNLCSDPARGNNSRSRPDSPFIRQPTNRMGVVWLLRSALAQAARDDSESPLKETLAGTRKLFSVSRTHYDISSLLAISEEFGVRPTVVGGQEAHKVADRLAKEGVAVILAPATTTLGLGQEETENAWNRAGLLAKAGVTMAFSGDDLLEQARFAYRFGCPRDVALAAITRSAATLLGVENRVGALAPGLDADMVAIDGDPLEFISPLRWVMVEGQIQTQVRKDDYRGT